MICIPVLFLALVYVYWKNIRKLFLGFLILAALLFSNSLAVNAYHLYFHDIFAAPAENNITLFSNFIYAADAEDSALIEDTKQRELFDTVFSQSYELGYNYSFSGGTLTGSISNLIDSHDKIKYDIVRGELDSFIEKYYPEQFNTYQGEQTKKEVLASLIDILRKDNLSHWLYTCITLVPEALMLSFNPVTPPSVLSLCYLYAALMTLFIAVSILYRLFREKSFSKGMLVLSSVFLLLAANAVGISFTLYGISRYTNYNLGLIYIALYLFLKEMVVQHKKRAA